MGNKRKFHDGNDYDNDSYGNFLRLILENCREEIVRMLEPELRSIVRNEFNLCLQQQKASSSRNLPREEQETRKFELKFVGELPSTLFTTNKIETVKREPLKVKLVDAHNQELVTTGSLSSMQVKIEPLKASFMEEDWSADEFKSMITTGRGENSHLLGGDRMVKLSSGVGEIRNLFFTDVSQKQPFRIGAVSVQYEIGVKEAVSGSFVVKHQRSEPLEKHYPPKDHDAVWRLDGIGKGGVYHTKLVSINVNTVGDFVRLLLKEPTRLSEILKMSGKPWNSLVAHANTCEADGQWAYTFEVPEQSINLVFDSVYRLLGWCSNRQHPSCFTSFTSEEHETTEIFKKRAYGNTNLFAKVNMLSHNHLNSLGFRGLQPFVHPNFVEQGMPFSSIDTYPKSFEFVHGQCPGMPSDDMNTFPLPNFVLPEAGGLSTGQFGQDPSIDILSLCPSRAVDDASEVLEIAHQPLEIGQGTLSDGTWSSLSFVDYPELWETMQRQPLDPNGCTALASTHMLDAYRPETETGEGEASCVIRATRNEMILRTILKFFIFTKSARRRRAFPSLRVS